MYDSVKIFNNADKFESEHILPYNGGGFYLLDDQTLLVEPVLPFETTWKERLSYKDREVPLRVYYFESNLSNTIFGIQGTIPTRLDERD